MLAVVEELVADCDFSVVEGTGTGMLKVVKFWLENEEWFVVECCRVRVQVGRMSEK